MSTVILVLILILLILLLCVIAFVSGFLIANKRFKARTMSITSDKEQKDIERRNREARIRQKQLENFWNYNGDKQEEINYD